MVAGDGHLLTARPALPRLVKPTVHPVGHLRRQRTARAGGVDRAEKVRWGNSPTPPVVYRSRRT